MIGLREKMKVYKIMIKKFVEKCGLARQRRWEYSINMGAMETGCEDSM
jgi:hypothetical protein